MGTSLRPLLKQFPSFLLAVDFNCLIHPALDSQGLLSDNHWPWISKEGPYQDRPPLCPFRL